MEPSASHGAGRPFGGGGGGSDLLFSVVREVDGKGSLSPPLFPLRPEGDGAWEGEVFFRGIKDASLKGNKFLTNYTIISLCSLNEKQYTRHSKPNKRPVARTYPI